MPWYVLLLVFAGSSLYSQRTLFPNFDTRSRSLGGAGLTSVGVDALWTNPAGLSNTERTAAAASAEQRFGINDLTIASVGIVLPQGFGARLASFTLPGYAEQRTGIGYGRRLTERWSIGTELDFYNQTTHGYGSKRQLAAGLGMHYQAIADLTLAVRLYHPFARKGHSPRISLGTAYRLSGQLLLLLEWERFRQGNAWRAGIEYQPDPSISLRAGVIGATGELSLGIGYRVLRRFELNAAAVAHARLGVSPSVGIVLRPEP
ncbi:hypothetical protein GGR28_000691 [Lewinella aquimaris]|uniref:PorV/PorQ family protein n=1 Tax=Neolewinella aquimaris TaxID=1835722 RepID=A0A840DYW2_9BACT|nr:hypothetical protein [Neolewinella aquimaris]MBB4078090.1 hypothetical protein [Neolewinella aquimaris]